MIPLAYYTTLGFILFVIGIIGVMIRRNIIMILISIELMLNAVNINFVAFSYYLNSITGQIFVFFVMTIAAAEVAVGLAIVIAAFRLRESINADEFNLMKW